MNTKTDNITGFKSEACIIARNEVEERLKSPSTAKFGYCYDSNVVMSGSNYTVKGYVDATNYYGAVIRTNYTVKIRIDSKDSYTVTSVDIK